MTQEIVKQPLTSEPGTRMRYSNAGYIVLGATIEQVGKQDYAGYVRRHILTPARMRDTFLGPWTPDGGSPAGGAVSTVGDMLRFAQALQGHRLLNAKLTRTVMEGKVQGLNKDSSGGRGRMTETLPGWLLRLRADGTRPRPCLAPWPSPATASGRTPSGGRWRRPCG
ncbi:serine hydrolase domain-containing protein [Nonomuraea rubra]|uniref:CubicO group peptidase (Beta-lactamase class C family) n=1 Tax=Nonomuraea rubra TaxID=46180 RepID=A0A7X0U082_9ACTN|nr:serine hydrolase domain-containing protein [Nonomuraea rubra]MBB6550487.1 CubicO group peptidase (beta-lactamase class C family) [Nonomuraea rubra]